MSITAIVEKDTIKLPEEVHWPDGTQVHIEPVVPIPIGANVYREMCATGAPTTKK